MSITELQKNEVKNILLRGNKIEAVKYLQDNFGLSLKEAAQLTKHIEKSLDRQSNTPEDVNFTFNSSKSKSGRLPGIIFACVGLILLGIAGKLIYNDIQFMEGAVEVNGVVINNPHQPTFEYEYNGQTYNYHSSSKTDPPAYSLGEEARMFVDPENPNDALVDTFVGRWLGITILFFMGSIFFLIGASVLYFLR